jgi:thioredoxin reductase
MAEVHPVIIVGGGPVGMVAGLLLARAGVPGASMSHPRLRKTFHDQSL